MRPRRRRCLRGIDLWDKRDELVSSLAYGAAAQAGDGPEPGRATPELLLLDEPSCGLTPTESADITARIKELGPKITVLMIAHDMDLVFGVAERIILLHFGEITAEGTLRRDPRQPDGQGHLHGHQQAEHGGRLTCWRSRTSTRGTATAYVLQGVTMEVKDGTVVALMGRNGMGKTTTIRSIMGLTPPRKGSITFNGPNWSACRPSRSRAQASGSCRRAA